VFVVGGLSGKKLTLNTFPARCGLERVSGAPSPRRGWGVMKIFSPVSWGDSGRISLRTFATQ